MPESVSTEKTRPNLKPDWEKARRETPGVDRVLHFNNAGAALMPQVVYDAVKSHLELELKIGGYEAADKQEPSIQGVYQSIANLLNCEPQSIAFVENATRAWDMAFYALPFGKTDRIVTGYSEYSSNYIAFLQMRKRTGVQIDVIPNDENGQISLEKLQNTLDKNVKLIALTHVPTNGGLINPAAEVGKIARAAGITYLLDACQSVGQIPLDVQAIGCDILSATGRKFLRGPRGTGFLYVAPDLVDTLEPPLLDLQSVSSFDGDHYEIEKGARRFENWESNISTKLGLAVAIDYALSWGLENIYEHVQDLASKLRTTLAKQPAITLQDLGKEKSGIVTFTVNGATANDIMLKLRESGINVSVSQPGYSIDMRARKLPELVRASVHYYNNEEEIERFADALKTITP